MTSSRSAKPAGSLVRTVLPFVFVFGTAGLFLLFDQLVHGLGHAKVGFTLEVYSHLLPGMQETAATSINTTLGKALKKRRKKSTAA